SWLIMDSLVGQEEKSTAALKSQIEKLQQERNEFQRMVIVSLLVMFLIDMRDFFLNAPNGSANPSLAGNEKREADPSQYPLGEKTDVFDLPFRMARGQIVESLRAKMAFIKVFLLPTFLVTEHMVQLQDVPKGISVISEATERERESSNVKLSLDVLLQESIMYTRLPKSKQLKLLCLKIGDNYGLNKDDKWSMKML
ncbi:hypothetical protein HID58_046083, partial [Brassica napus]